MIPKDIELQILQELESINQTKSIAILHDKDSEWACLNSDKATSYALENKLTTKQIDGKHYFRITDLKELFFGSVISIVVFEDYSQN